MFPESVPKRNGLSLLALQYTQQELNQKIHQHFASKGQLTEVLRRVMSIQNNQNATGIEKYWISRNFPDECRKVDDVWWQIALPGYKEQFITSYVLHQLASLFKSLLSEHRSIVFGLIVTNFSEKENGPITALRANILKFLQPPTSVYSIHFDSVNFSLTINRKVKHILIGSVAIGIIYGAYRYWKKHKKE